MVGQEEEVSGGEAAGAAAAAAAAHTHLIFLLTASRSVSSCSASYCATVALSTSLTMEGSTRSSQSSPRLIIISGSFSFLGRERMRRLSCTCCRSLVPVREDTMRGRTRMSKTVG